MSEKPLNQSGGAQLVASAVPRVYHAPYYAVLHIDRPMKVYVQQIETVRGNSVPISPDAASMGGYSVWFDEAMFDVALANQNRELAGKISVGKGTEVIQKGSTLWRVMTWSEKFQKYLPDERNGAYRKKEYALERCRGDYTLHREFLRFASHGKIDGLLPPDAVDFSVPNEFMEMHLGI